MKRITKLNENEYISKEVERCSSPLGVLAELVFYLILLGVLTKFVNMFM